MTKAKTFYSSLRSPRTELQAMHLPPIHLLAHHSSPLHPLHRAYSIRAYSTGRTKRDERASTISSQARSTEPALSHISSDGHITMVDTSAKSPSHRVAVAIGTVTFSRPDVPSLIDANSLSKGNVLATAQIAGIQAAKRCAELIPLCHQVPLSHVHVDLKTCSEGVEIVAVASTTAATGVEMEALTAVGVAGLTVYDMCKAVDKEMVIGGVRLVYKAGGRNGAVLHDKTEKGKVLLNELMAKGLVPRVDDVSGMQPKHCPTLHLKDTA